MSAVEASAGRAWPHARPRPGDDRGDNPASPARPGAAIELDVVCTWVLVPVAAGELRALLRDSEEVEVLVGDRPHGSYVRYVQGTRDEPPCRCDLCRQAKRNYEAERTRRTEPPYVDAQPARDHIAWLRDRHGLGVKAVASISGVPHGAVSKLVYGDYARGTPPSRRIRKATRDAILAVKPHHAGPFHLVDAKATWRRIDDLTAAGIPKTRIAERLGQTGAGLQLHRRRIERRHASAVLAMHREWRAGRLEHLTRRADQLDPGPVLARLEHIAAATGWGTRRLAAELAISTTTLRNLGASWVRPSSAAKVDTLWCRVRVGQALGEVLAAGAAGLPQLAAALHRQKRHAGRSGFTLVAELLDEPDVHAWRARSACADHDVDPAWFFAAQGDSVSRTAALEVCARCEVRVECLEQVGLYERFGVWGGTTEKERRTIRRSRRIVLVDELLDADQADVELEVSA